MTALKEPFRPQPITLTDLPVGSAGRVHSLQGELSVCARLRELGFCESAVVEKISGEKSVICLLCGMRIALSDRAATHILVELIRGRN